MTGWRAPRPRVLTPDVWQRHLATTGEHLHVFLNGRDVTKDCVYASIDEGKVTHLLRNAEGKFYCAWPGADPARRTVSGTVTFKPGGPLR